MRKIYACLIAILVVTSGKAQDELSIYIDNFRKELGAASVCVALVNKEGISWETASGFADIEKQELVTTKHIYALGSVSKLYTGLALMKLYEEGRLKLDDDVNSFVPFSVRNPKFPEQPITFRMLLTHTSSIADRQQLQYDLYADGDPNSSLKELTENFFSPKGKYYQLDNYYDFEPGTTWEYCNWNFVLIGYIIENLTGQPFNEYCREVVLDPLQMKESAWFLRNLDQDKLATLYIQNADGSLKPLKPFSWPGYSDGNLRASVEEVANILTMVINDGSFAGKQVLKSETLSEMISPQGVESVPPGFLKDMGLVWHIAEVNQEVLMHTGEPAGTIIAVFYCPKTSTGFVSFMTGVNWKIPNATQKWIAYLMHLIDQAAKHGGMN